MKHHLKLTCKKSAVEVFDTCKQVFLPHNYRLIKKSDDEFVFEGGGLSSTRQNPLLGATKISISISNNTLEVNSELNGVAFMWKFVILFPPALCIILSVTFYLSGMGVESVKQTLLMVIPWLFISPLMCIFIKKRTEKAIRNIAHNIVNV